MPVTTAKKGGKWRVVESSGGIALNAAGTPLDGGGHASETHASSQARAVNASLRRQGKIKSNELKAEVTKRVVVVAEDECGDCLSVLVGGEIGDGFCMGCKESHTHKQLAVFVNAAEYNPGKPDGYRPRQIVYSADEYGWPMWDGSPGPGTVGLPMRVDSVEAHPTRLPIIPDYGHDFACMESEPWWRDLYKAAGEGKAKPLNLLLVNHSEAEEPREDQVDDDRELTAQGREDAEKAFKGLTRLGIIVDRTLSSPTKRAQKTAELLARELGDGAYRMQDGLHHNDFDVRKVLEAIDEMPSGSTLAIVGHREYLGTFTSLLVDGPTTKTRTEKRALSFGHSSVGHLEFAGPRIPGKAVFKALFVSRSLRKLAK